MLPAIAAFSDSTGPGQGIVTRSSACSISFRDSPAPSFPIRMAAGVARSRSGAGNSALGNRSQNSDAGRP